jgi:hypothetical protein
MPADPEDSMEAEFLTLADGTGTPISIGVGPAASVPNTLPLLSPVLSPQIQRKSDASAFSEASLPADDALGQPPGGHGGSAQSAGPAAAADAAVAKSSASILRYFASSAASSASSGSGLLNAEHSSASGHSTTKAKAKTKTSKKASAKQPKQVKKEEFSKTESILLLQLLPQGCPFGFSLILIDTCS